MHNKKLEVCWLTLNRECNLRCNYCYARGTGYDVKKNMSLENAKRILDFCKTGKIKHLVLIGGEPLLYPDLFPLLRECSEKDFDVHLSTNGIAFSNSDFCEKVFSIIRPSINVSIKGYDSASYIGTTSCDAFSDLLEAFANFKKNDVDFHVSYVLTEDNLSNFLIGVKKAFEFGASALHLSFAYDFNTASIKDLNFLKKNNPVFKISKFVSMVDEIENVTSGNWDFENGYPLCFYSQEQIKKIGNHLATGCQMLFGDGILFDPDLNIIPCNSMYSVKMGQMGKDFDSYDEFEVFSSEKEYLLIRRYLESLPSSDCKKCEKLKYCGGGCTLFWSQVDFKSVKEYLDCN